MMGMPWRQSANQLSAVRYAHRERRPFVFESVAEASAGHVTLPYVGFNVPEGWEFVEGAEWFVDNGSGSPDDTLPQFLFNQALALYVEAHPNHGFAITESGRYHYVVHAFRRKAER